MLHINSTIAGFDQVKSLFQNQDINKWSFFYFQWRTGGNGTQSFPCIGRASPPVLSSAGECYSFLFPAVPQADQYLSSVKAAGGGARGTFAAVVLL